MFHYISKNKSERVTIFIHGAGGSSNHWSWLADNISENIQVIAFDLPGHGKSSGYVPDNFRQALNLISIFIEQMNIKKPFNLIGHSLGGMLAQAYAIKFPENIHNLVLISTSYSVMIHPKLLEQLKTNVLDKEFIRAGFEPHVNKAVIELIIRDFQNTKLAPNAADFMNISKYNLKGDVPKIKNRTLIIMGDCDKVISPRKTRELNKLIENSVSVVIKNAGHYPHLEKYNETAKVIESFLLDN